jgi:hypothetical protein
MQLPQFYHPQMSYHSTLITCVLKNVVKQLDQLVNVMTFRSLLDASREYGLELDTEKTKCMAVSCHQNVGLTANKFLSEYNKVQIFGKNSNKSKLHSRKSKSRLEMGEFLISFSLKTKY